jgi:3-hydroxymyristoyl/3-hydroxydecanoyl-(acyl carrier protein) dehydratase
VTFSFVDRITAIEPDRAEGVVYRAPDAAPLPPWLIIEAVGQLAAWVTMAQTSFQSRPVAALVGEVSLTGNPIGGSVTLEAQLERIDGRAVLYSGRARVGDAEIAALRRCVGPLLPMALFDDPETVRARFAALRSGDAPPVDTRTPPRPVLAAVALAGGTAHAELHVPTEAAFFADHFPRRPVYPATLLADAQNQLALPLAADALDAAADAIELARAADIKVRAFSAPGQLLLLSAETQPVADGHVPIAVVATADGKHVARGVFTYRRRQWRQ